MIRRRAGTARPGAAMRLAAAFGLAVAMGFGPGVGPGAWAQSATVGGGESPIEVLSDDGIEWHRDDKLYIARGNAVAIQGADRVRGDVLVAHYRETPDGATEIWRMEARGSARIETPTQTVTGASAVYELDSGVLVVRGGGPRLVTETETVTATESLEYWSRERMAVARGDARAVRANGDTVEADVLTGYFDAGASGDADGGAAATGADPGPGGADPAAVSGGALDRMEAFGDVVITTAKEVVRGDRAVYDVPAGLATVVGNVTIATESDQLAGDRAVMNLNTGVSTLEGGEGGGRARALITPQRPAAEAAPRAPYRP
ncbi:LptA/OstA family protein [Roseospira goensis]|uniref:Lipopolysaccharide export system protein LptA n=1 Tax=Roseospira goensis TaxID=391922 RepID=A0A7W6WLH4_9PROT|nr:hypothetical protein [Roseospira goensis]MBB4286412.1 lipopolysaccharide export system protein LptA [Roseospira goensis]